MQKNEIAAIRQQLKKQFPNWVFSVRNTDRGVTVVIRSGNADFGDLLDCDGCCDIYAEAHSDTTLDRILQIIKSAPAAVGGAAWYDHGNVQADYADVPYNILLRVGEYGAPYQCLAQ